MTRLALAFNEEIGEDRFKIYFEFLGDADYQSANEAINTLIKGSKWFPKIAEIEKLMYPEPDLEMQYIRSLENKTREAIGWMSELEPSEEGKKLAKKMVNDLFGKWKEEDEKKEDERRVKFEKSRENLKKQARLLMK